MALLIAGLIVIPAPAPWESPLFRHLAAFQVEAAKSSEPLVSLDRIRAALERPPSVLVIDAPVPDFSIHVVELEIFERHLKRLWYVDPGWRPRQWSAPGAFGSQPLVSVDLLAIGNAVIQTVQQVRRARAETAATREVQQTIRQYCESRIDRGAGLQMCDTVAR